MKVMSQKVLPGVIWLSRSTIFPPLPDLMKKLRRSSCKNTCSHSFSWDGPRLLIIIEQPIHLLEELPECRYLIDVFNLSLNTIAIRPMWQRRYRGSSVMAMTRLTKRPGGSNKATPRLQAGA